MDRDGRAKPPSDEVGSFDLSKMSEAEAAAELAARMARWRNARRQPDPAHTPSAGADAVDPQEPEPPEPPAAQRAAADRSVVPRELDPAIAARIHAALRLATPPRLPRLDGGEARPARRASSYGNAFETLLAEGLNTRAIGMGAERPVDRPLLRTRARGMKDRRAAAWRAPPPAPVTRARQVPRFLHQLTDRVRTESRAAWRTFGPVLERRAGDALQRARALRDGAQDTAVAGWRAIATALAPRIDEGGRHVRATAAAARRCAVTAWHAAKAARADLAAHPRPSARALAEAARRVAADRFVLAGAAVIAVAIVGWLLVQPDRTAPREIARAPETGRTIERPDIAQPGIAQPKIERLPAGVEARAIPASSDGSPHASSDMLGPMPPPRTIAPPTHVATAAPISAMLNPTVVAPQLAARLKPDSSEPAAPPEDAATGPGRSTGSRPADDMLDGTPGDGTGRGRSRR